MCFCSFFPDELDKVLIIHHNVEQSVIVSTGSQNCSYDNKPFDLA